MCSFHSNPIKQRASKLQKQSRMVFWFFLYWLNPFNYLPHLRLRGHSHWWWLLGSKSKCNCLWPSIRLVSHSLDYIKPLDYIKKWTSMARVEKHCFTSWTSVEPSLSCFHIYTNRSTVPLQPNSDQLLRVVSGLVPILYDSFNITKFKPCSVSNYQMWLPQLWKCDQWNVYNTDNNILTLHLIFIVMFFFTL